MACDEVVFKFGELGFRGPAFLEVEIGAVVEGFNGDLLPPSSGKENKREIGVVETDMPEKFNAVYSGHLVIGDDTIVIPVLCLIECLPDGLGSIDSQFS